MRTAKLREVSPPKVECPQGDGVVSFLQGAAIAHGVAYGDSGVGSACARDRDQGGGAVFDAVIVGGAEL